MYFFPYTGLTISINFVFLRQLAYIAENDNTKWE